MNLGLVLGVSLGIGIDSPRNAEELVERVLENRGETIGFDIVLGTEDASAEQLDASWRMSIPTSYVVERVRTVVWIGNPQEPDTGGEGAGARARPAGEPNASGDR